MPPIIPHPLPHGHQSEAGRQKLLGVYRFLGEGHAWDLSLIRSPEEFGLGNLCAAGENAYDGFLISLAEDAKMKSRHVELQTPTVFISRPDPLLFRELPLSVFVNDDDRKIAETAAQHLLVQGAAGSYVYAEASTNRAWRRLADLRFREQTRKSILEHILDVRLAEVCRQLEKTDNRIADIALSCHCDAAALKNLFRRHFGMSMRDWRKRANSSESDRSVTAQTLEIQATPPAPP